MRIDRDTFREILDSLLRNRSRSLLTGFGVFWGVFMLMLLSGGGNGFREILEKNFEGFAHNTCIVFPTETTKPYKGFQKGRYWSLNLTDIDRLRNLVPELETISPLMSLWGKSVTNGDKLITATVKGVRPDYSNIETPKLVYGRYINQMDLQDTKKVCVIGKKVYKTLFPEGGDPCGNMVVMDGVYYQVVGVDYNEGNMNVNGRADEAVTIPQTTMSRTYNFGNEIQLLCFTAKEGIQMADILPKVRGVIARGHYVHPDDEQAMFMINTQVLFGIIDNLFKGINFLVWLIGLGTLLAGAIGVSNIMMVSVKERTTEIGIRRAIGATPNQILWQIIAESIVLTLVAGMMGIVASVLVLGAVELGMTEDGILKATFQVSFGVALLAALLLSVLGSLAGLAPSLRAMAIKPVDAMRDE
ncbi:MAG: ABC transporter permease [Bacteroidales bacterium]|nr:ABC transporter permease [Bacteroidales bacterium]